MAITRGDHTESIHIEYDPTKITYEELLDVFWTLHDPTKVHSHQYRSAIFVHNEYQRSLAHASLNKKEQQLDKKVHTAVEGVSQFHDAEG